MKVENYKQIRQTIALLTSMVACGEPHSETSNAAVVTALNILDAEPLDGAGDKQDN